MRLMPNLNLLGIKLIIIYQQLNNKVWRFE